ncbi:arabinose efflux permease [Vibrio ishigakensis]|uniref:Arabinose efflux permease n=1 Tax=Vibrio ishigakensis TaxID=1481914 RepID=A0A0B8QJJ3_9VIBR|nr:arabinose efflux permease [Vibrio ishigakensis]
MADVEHKEKLDTLDRLSVIGYRFGISLLAFSYLYLAYITIAQVAASVVSLLAISAASIAANLHIYDKNIRAVIVWSSWFGLLVIAVIGQPLISQLLFCITFSGIALKESFCFKVPGLKLIPFFIGLTLVGQYFYLDMLTAISALVVGLIIGFMSIKKWQMPLHFDIGNKANYQI